MPHPSAVPAKSVYWKTETIETEHPAVTKLALF